MRRARPASHVLLDLLSSARIRAFWPVADRQVSLPLVAMADPGWPACWPRAIPRSGSRRTTMARLTAAGLVAACSSRSRASSSEPYPAGGSKRGFRGRARSRGRRTVGVADGVVGLRPDRGYAAALAALAGRSVRALHHPARAGHASRSRLPRARYGAQLEAVHRLGFASEQDEPDGRRGVFWSDIRFCGRPRPDDEVACGLWFGGRSTRAMAASSRNGYVSDGGCRTGRRLCTQRRPEEHVAERRALAHRAHGRVQAETLEAGDPLGGRPEVELLRQRPMASALRELPSRTARNRQPADASASRITTAPPRLQTADDGSKKLLLIARPHQVQDVEQDDDVGHRHRLAPGVDREDLRVGAEGVTGDGRHARPRLDPDQVLDVGRRRTRPGPGTQRVPGFGEQREEQPLTAADIHERARRRRPGDRESSPALRDRPDRHASCRGQTPTP